MLIVLIVKYTRASAAEIKETKLTDYLRGSIVVTAVLAVLLIPDMKQVSHSG